MNRKMLKGYIFAVLSAVIYGCMPLMAKRIYSDGANPITLVFLRNFFSILPLAFLAARGGRKLKVQFRAVSSLSVISILGCSVTPILLFSSYRFIPSGTATVFHFVYPAVVIVLEIIFSKKKVLSTNLVGVALCIVGILCFYSPGVELNGAGSALALLSGLTFACYVVLLSHFPFKEITGFLFTFYVTVISSVFTFVFALFTDQLAFPETLFGWLICIVFSLFVTIGAGFFFQQSAFLIGSERTSILSTLEPITGVVLGVLALNETLNFGTVIGSVLVLCASVLIAVFDFKKKTKK